MALPARHGRKGGGSGEDRFAARSGNGDLCLCLAILFPAVSVPIISFCLRRWPPDFLLFLPEWRKSRVQARLQLPAASATLPLPPTRYPCRVRPLLSAPSFFLTFSSPRGDQLGMNGDLLAGK
ncbi:hypothetical protein HPB48_023985 [Haemaphysalis longicornis]|uniref:Uncharacterized protein n=1 Tax=Haemaphysalis longicornis TaxID=44386 RepID=A0A9J6GXE6_HAELO|nr:hypothetical protein HPB48_023985 [Haemaphysalis longicornis]